MRLQSAGPTDVFQLLLGQLSRECTASNHKALAGLSLACFKCTPHLCVAVSIIKFLINNTYYKNYDLFHNYKKKITASFVIKSLLSLMRSSILSWNHYMFSFYHHLLSIGIRIKKHRCR
jgi:hypothetical protein